MCIHHIRLVVNETELTSTGDRLDNLTNDDEHSSPCSVLCDPCLVAHRLFHGRHLRSRRSWIPVLACASSGTRQKYWRSFCFRGGPELQYDPPSMHSRKVRGLMQSAQHSLCYAATRIRVFCTNVFCKDISFLFQTLTSIIYYL